MTETTQTEHTLALLREEWTAPYREALRELRDAGIDARRKSSVEVESVKRFVAALGQANIVLGEAVEGR